MVSVRGGGPPRYDGGLRARSARRAAPDDHVSDAATSRLRPGDGGAADVGTAVARDRSAYCWPAAVARSTSWTSAPWSGMRAIRGTGRWLSARLAAASISAARSGAPFVAAVTI